MITGRNNYTGENDLNKKGGMLSSGSCVCIDVYCKSQIKAVEELSDDGSSNIKRHANTSEYQAAMLNWVGMMLQSHTE